MISSMDIGVSRKLCQDMKHWQVEHVIDSEQEASPDYRKQQNLKVPSGPLIHSLKAGCDSLSQASQHIACSSWVCTVFQRPATGRERM